MRIPVHFPLLPSTVPRLLHLIARSIVLGLAAAFVVVWFRPDMLPALNHSPPAGGNQVESYADAVNRAARSVVSIYTMKIVHEPLGEFADPLFRELYRGRTRARPRTGLGSGVIVSPDGYILTAQHVVADVDNILIALWNGLEIEARLIGTDPVTDLAVLKVELEDLPAATLSTNGDMRVGDVVLAIGNAFGLRHTVTHGIVSGIGRGDVDLVRVQDLIQTDAAINSGNSGGALINPRGEVIGINSMTYSQASGAQGISFAIPARLARDVMEQIIEYGRVERAWMGANMVETSIASRSRFGLDQGVEISQVVYGGPAWRAGLLPGDILVSADGTPITSAREFLLRISQDQPGKAIELEAIRDGQAFTTSVTLIQQPPLRG